MPQLIQAHNDSRIIDPGRAPNAPLIQASAPPPLQFRVTGSDPNVRPDDRSVWNEQTQQWERGTVAYGNWQNALADERRDLTFTNRQRADWDQLNDLTSEIMSSDRYTDAEKKELTRQIDAKRLGIQPLPQLPGKDDNFNPADSFAKNSYRDEEGNTWVFNSKTGSWSWGAGAQKPGKTTDATADAYRLNEENYNGERMKIFAELMKAKKPMLDAKGNVVGLGNDPMYTPEEAMAKAGEMARQAFPAMQFKTDAEKKAAEEAEAAAAQPQPQPAANSMLNTSLASGESAGPGAAQPIPLATSQTPPGQVVRPNAEPVTTDKWIVNKKNKK